MSEDIFTPAVLITSHTCLDAGLDQQAIEQIQQVRQEKEKGIHYGISTAFSNSSHVSILANSVTKSATKENQQQEYPEGGYGWWVVFACFLSQYIISGPLYSYGVYLPHYSKAYPEASLTTLTAVGTLQAAILCLLGPFSGSLASKIGYRPTLHLGNILLTLSLIIASFAQQVWQLFVFHGFIYGLGASLIYFPTISSPTHWFCRRRGLVIGITVAGSGMGGLTLSPLIDVSIRGLGMAWTLRIQALLSLILVTIVGLLIKLPAKVATTKLLDAELATAETIKEKKVVCVDDQKDDLKNYIFGCLLKDRRFYLMFSMGLLLGLGYLAPFYLLSSYAISVGLLSWQGALITGFLSGADAIGKVTIGYGADYLGHLNCMIFFMFIGGLACGIFWPLSKSFPSLILFAITYGFCEGGFITLFSVVCADLFGVDRISTILGLANVSFGITTLIGTPIISAIGNSSGGFSVAFIFSGLMILTAVSLLLVIRFAISRKFWFLA